MEVPSSEDEGVLMEWSPYTNLINQIPLKMQSGLFPQDLSLTCIDTSDEYLALGTNFGLVYWYGRKKGDLQRLRCEVFNSPITSVKIVSTVDFMVAAGNKNGQVTVFQVPKVPPENIPDSLKPKNSQQVERYTIGDIHKSEITAIEWSKNGMKLFSGDKTGLIVMTEVDFYMHLCKSSEIINETDEIVQISYYQNYLLVSSVYRSIICHKNNTKWDVNQVGKKDRKSLMKLGGIFHYSYDKPNDVTVFSARPGLRVWTSDRQGEVLQTLLFREPISSPSTQVELLNPAQRKPPKSTKDANFGTLRIFKDKYIVSYNEDQLYILNPDTLSAVAVVDKLRRILCVAVSKDEILILEGERSLVRLAYSPDYQLEADDNLMTKSLTNPIMFAVNTIKDLKNAESQIHLSDMTFQCDQFLNTLKESTAASASDSSGVIKAEECFELPPVKELNSEIDVNILEKLMHTFIGDKEGELESADEYDNQELIIGKRANPESVMNTKKYDAINDKCFEDDILFTGNKSKKITNDLKQKKQTAQSTKIITKQTNSDITDEKMTKPCLLNLSFSSDKSLLPDNRSPETIERDIKDKEEILAKILNLEPVTMSMIIPQSPDPPFLASVDLTNCGGDKVAETPVTSVNTSTKLNTSPVIKKIPKSKPININDKASEPIVFIETPPKCVSIPNLWNLKEIKINMNKNDSLSNGSFVSDVSTETIDGDWELV